MGIQINGNSDNISATDGSLTITGASLGGSLGIGTDNPDHSLTVYDVNGSASGGILVQNAIFSANIDRPYLIAGTRNYDGTTTNWGTFGFQHRIKANSGGTGRITIDTVNGEVFCVDNTGDIGIGTDNPSRSLDICFDSESGIELRNYTAGKNLQFLVKDDGTGRIVQPSDKSLQFDRAGTVSLVIASNGDVGIGTAEPSQNLDVVDTSAHVILDLKSSAADFSEIRFSDTDAAGRGKITYNHINDRFEISTSASEVVRIGAAGTVHIGDVTPTVIQSGKLNVYSDVSGALCQFVHSAGNGGLRLGGTGNGSAANLVFSNDYNSGTWSDEYTIRMDGADDSLNFLRGGVTADSTLKLTSDGRARFVKGTGDPVVIGGVTNAPSIYRNATNMGGIHFSTFSVLPANEDGNASDNSFDLGATSFRWDDVYATNGTIQTSDQSLKQDVAQLTDAEIAAAKVIRGLVKKYRWIDSVEEKGDDARIHVGVIAQEVEQAFVDQGLDPNRYGLFCKNSFYTVDGEAMGPDSALYTEDTPGAILVERRGVRYPQLLAFVMAAVDAEATDFESRLAALEAQ